jgi:hypothetical protein
LNLHPTPNPMHNLLIIRVFLEKIVGITR